MKKLTSILLAVSTISANPISNGFVDPHKFYSLSESRQIVVKQKANEMLGHYNETGNQNYKTLSNVLNSNAHIIDKQALRDIEKLDYNGFRPFLGSHSFDSKVNSTYENLNEGFSLDKEVNQAIEKGNFEYLGRYVNDQKTSIFPDLTQKQLELLTKISSCFEEAKHQDYQGIQKVAKDIVTSYDYGSVEFSAFGNVKSQADIHWMWAETKIWKNKIEETGTKFDSKKFNILFKELSKRYKRVVEFEKQTNWRMVDDLKNIIEEYQVKVNKGRHEKIDMKLNTTKGILEYNVRREGLLDRLF